MGDYTRMKFEAALKADAPKDVIAILEDLAGGREVAESRWPGAWFAKIASGFLTNNSGAGYFPQATGVASLDRMDDGRFRISSHCSFKSDATITKAFFAWIAPHLDAAPGDVVGEVELDGYCGTQLSTLVLRVGCIDEVRQSRACCDQNAGFF